MREAIIVLKITTTAEVLSRSTKHSKGDVTVEACQDSESGPGAGGLCL
jgi:hypothetical protein